MRQTSFLELDRAHMGPVLAKNPLLYVSQKLTMFQAVEMRKIYGQLSEICDGVENKTFKKGKNRS